MSKNSESYLEIQLDQQPIELCKLLKIADLVTGGGEAKVVISEGYVLLNGEVEYQKRKKVYHNDIVEFNGEVLQVVIVESLTDTETKNDSVFINTEASPAQSATAKSDAREASKKPSSPAKNSTNKSQKKAAPTGVDTANRGKRKPISF